MVIERGELMLEWAKEQEASAPRQTGTANRITPAECKDDVTIQSIWITFESPSKTTDILK